MSFRSTDCTHNSWSANRIHVTSHRSFLFMFLFFHLFPLCSWLGTMNFLEGILYLHKSYEGAAECQQSTWPVIIVSIIVPLKFIQCSAPTLCLIANDLCGWYVICLATIPHLDAASLFIIHLAFFTYDTVHTKDPTIKGVLSLV
jgi:hypothetical protein